MKEKFKIRSADSTESALFYSGSPPVISEACAGCVRVDLGRGKEFWHTWHGNHEELNDAEFKEDLQTVIDGLRNNLLKDRSSMQAYCSANDALKLGESYGFKAETESHVFYLRCFPCTGNYDCYCYGYEKCLLEQAMTEGPSEDMNQEMGGISL